MASETYLIIKGESEAVRVYGDMSAIVGTTDGRSVRVTHSDFCGGGTSVREGFTRTNMNTGSIGRINLNPGEEFEIPKTKPNITVVCARKAE